MEKVSNILDSIVPRMMASIKEDCLNKPFTAERSIIVDQILFVEEKMAGGMSFHDAVKSLR